MDHVPRSRKYIRPKIYPEAKAEQRTGAKSRKKNQSQKPKKEPGPMGPHGPRFFFRLLAPVLFSAFGPGSFFNFWQNPYFNRRQPRYILTAARYNSVCRSASMSSKFGMSVGFCDGRSANEIRYVESVGCL